MRNIIPKIGRVGIILTVTTLSILLSVFICRVVLGFYDASEETYFIVSLVSIIAPAMIAPLVTWYLIGLLVQLHELELKQRELATYDELTGVMNRRVFFENFELLKKISDRNGSNLSLAYIDIDDFKAINDKNGHMIGDQVLKRFATTLKQEIRSSDVLGRIGGEEFAIILPDTDLSGSYTILERIRANIARHPIIIDEQRIGLSISIGLTHSQKGNILVVDQLVHQADTALYKAKSEGKNRIVQYS